MKEFIKLCNERKNIITWDIPENMFLITIDEELILISLN